jgi:hypothetical protein
MLQTLANLAQILGAVAVIAGIAFGFTQVRQFRQQRQDALAVELMKSIQDAEFTRSLRILLEVPDNTSAAEFRSLGPMVEEAAWALGAEWWQWLAERLEARGRPTAVPAYIRLGGWRAR